MLNCVAISDTHNRHKSPRLQIPEADLLIFTGDCCGRGDWYEFLDFALWFKALPHKHKVVVFGNHDWVTYNEFNRCKLELEGCHVLNDSSVEIEGFKFYGTSYQKEFHNWAWNLPAGGEKLQMVMNAIPEDTDVLLTHNPPWEILDYVPVRNCGCELLRERVDQLKLLAHCFGHIHYSNGQLEKNGTLFVNSSICDEDYIPCQSPQLFTLEK